MNANELSLFAGALLSLVFSYTPGLKDWFEAKESTTKRLIMAGALLVVSAVVFSASCLDLGLAFTITCDKGGAVGLATTFLSALVANQGTFLISPKPPTVEDELKAQAAKTK